MSLLSIHLQGGLVSSWNSWSLYDYNYTLYCLFEFFYVIHANYTRRYILLYVCWCKVDVYFFAILAFIYWQYQYIFM